MKNIGNGFQSWNRQNENEYKRGSKADNMINYPVRIEYIKDCGNGYGWSVIKPQPKDNGMPIFELAVIKDGRICFDTPITKYVIRGTWPHICNIKREIRRLPCVQ